MFIFFYAKEYIMINTDNNVNETTNTNTNTNTNKQIFIPPPVKKRETASRKHEPKLPAAPKKRMITATKRWDFQPHEHTLEYQLSLLVELRDWWITDEGKPLNVRSPERGISAAEASVGLRGITGDGLPSKVIAQRGIPRTPAENPKQRVQLVKQLIHSKWYGYRAQDIEKDLFCIDQFINEIDMVDLLIDSRLLCFYCRKEMQLLYEHVRETLQWSIERIDNKKGHDRGNVVIACLGCNLRRKTMYYERFRMTKQLHIVRTP